MSYLLSRPGRISGVIAQSGYIPLQSGIHVDEAGVKRKPIIMTHGYEDSRMPLEWSQQSRDYLLQHGANVEYHNFHMDHTITPESLNVIKLWFDKQLKSQNWKFLDPGAELLLIMKGALKRKI